MNFKAEARIIETVLFMESEPMDINSLTRITKLSKEIIIEAVKCLEYEYNDDRHGIELVEIGGGYTFAPKKELWEVLKARYGKKNDSRLSKAAIETLSIIAYSQPITKSEIESIRGVSADGMIKLLISKDMVREVGKKDIPGKPVQFGTTKEFLKLFRLKSIADLPKLDDVTLTKFRNINEQDAEEQDAEEQDAEEQDAEEQDAEEQDAEEQVPEEQVPEEQVPEEQVPEEQDINREGN